MSGSVQTPQTQDDATKNVHLRPYIITTIIFSLVVNLVMLVSPLYMLQVYDRVLSSGSIETLTMVSIAAFGVLCAYGFAESSRRKALALMSEQIQDDYGPMVFQSSFSDVGAAQALPKKLADLNSLQKFLQHGMPLPLFDLPFTPIFILAMFLVHPTIGWIGVVGALLLIAITAFTEISSRGSVKKAEQADSMTTQFANEIGRRGSIVRSLGMLDPLLEQWKKRKDKSTKMTLDGLSRSNFFSAHARGFRQMLQVAALGVGGYLVLQLEVTAGAIVAGSILMGRALSPIDQALGAWRQFIRARQSWASLKEAERDVQALDLNLTPMSRPDADLTAEALQVSFPNADKALLPKFNLHRKAGSILAVLGPSGVGKTTILQTCAGAWAPFDGVVRLGGRDIHRWADKDRGQYVGYAPQEVNLLPGTIAQNISRFSEASPEEVIEAAKKAGFHDLIVRLPDSYDTLVGTGGIHLSQGQQKAIGLARAFFRDPVLMILDEPGSNLDLRSLEKLNKGLAEAKSRGAIIIFTTHDMRFLALADDVLLLDKGSLNMMSSKDYVAQLKQARLSQKEGA